MNKVYVGNLPFKSVEADLEEIIRSNNPEAFKYFYLFFTKDAFIPDTATGKMWIVTSI